MTRRPCGHWDGTTMRRCSSTDQVHLYLTGPRCPLHTPAAIAGRPEPVPGPGYTPQAIPSPLGDSRLFDARAVASGKRRASPHTYRAAQAATRKDT